jgi:hypothetical protein
MRRPTIAYAQKGLPIQCISERDFLFPDADEKYVLEVLAYIQSYDFKTFNALLWTKTPEEVVATFPYLSDREKSFACRALFDASGVCRERRRYRRISPSDRPGGQRGDHVCAAGQPMYCAPSQTGSRPR